MQASLDMRARAGPPGDGGRFHVALIMDGNRRWARARRRPAILGHREGADAVRRAVDACPELGVTHLTLFAFSSENWRRPSDEVGELMGLLRHYLRSEVGALHENGVRLRVIGERDGLDDDIREMVDGAERLTADNGDTQLIIALNYGGRREIARAARRLAERVERGELRSAQIDEDAVARELYAPDLPDPDLMIRTSGELRISNFLLWQMAYTELVFLPIPWPEFDRAHFRAAVEEFRNRHRRFGAQG